MKSPESFYAVLVLGYKRFLGPSYVISTAREPRDALLIQVGFSTCSTERWCGRIFYAFSVTSKKASKHNSHHDKHHTSWKVVKVEQNVDPG